MRAQVKASIGAAKTTTPPVAASAAATTGNAVQPAEDQDLNDLEI